MRISLALILSFTIHGLVPQEVRAQKADLDKIYADESHCLTGPEIRSVKDSPISCYCRDAIVDAHYVYHTYGFSMETMDFKDPNLKGTILTLERNANEMCSDKENFLEADTAWVHEAIEDEHWKWNGPEVTRTYPPDSAVKQIKPDAHNLRSVPFLVMLTYRDSKGRVMKTESFTAHEIEPVRDKKPATR